MKNTDSIPPAADSANFPSPVWRQLSFDFAPPTDSAPRALEPEPARASPPCGSPHKTSGETALAAPDLSEPGQPAKPARKQRRKAAAKPVLTIVPTPDPGAQPGPVPEVDTYATDGAPQEAEVYSLRQERIARDSRIGELNEIADDAFSMAKDRKKYAQAGADTWQEEDANFKQWALAAATHMRSITAIQKHTEFLNKEW